MTYIAPDTNIQFFRNVNIDPDHENSIYFATTAQKDAYFDALPHLTAPTSYYQREKRGYCRVEFPIKQMLNRTYMRFKNNQVSTNNPLFEDKWFYAFVDNVEYVNNITTEVQYTLDPLMTWMGSDSFGLDDCFIERQHTLTDNIGDNLVPEPVSVNNYVENLYFVNNGTDNIQASPQRSGVMNNKATDWEYLVVLEPTTTDLPAGELLGIYSGLHYEECADAAAVNTLLAQLPSMGQDRVQGIYYIPKFFRPTAQNPAPKSKTINIKKPVPMYTQLDGYLGPVENGVSRGVKNNKLYTYPFNYILANNTEGQTAQFLFELFTGGTCDFIIKGIIGEQTQIICSPLNYRGHIYGLTGLDDVNNQMMIKDFPMCAWVIDTYKAYLAQQAVSIPASVASSALTGALTGGVAGAVVGGAGAAVTGMVRTIAGEFKAAQHPFEARGVNAPQISCAGLAPYKDFYFFRICLRRDEAKRIDDFFDMFGYQINEVAKPNMCARPYWTYIKTVGAHVSGFMPASDMRTIEEIFNKGVRLWNGAALYSTPATVYIGNYSLDNRPGTIPSWPASSGGGGNTGNGASAGNSSAGGGE